MAQPNLQHVGLLEVGYRGLESLCADQTCWTLEPTVAVMSPGDREFLVPAILEQFRRKPAIARSCLQESTQHLQIRRRSDQYLNEFWGLDRDVNELRTASRFVQLGPSTWAAEGFCLNERSAYANVFGSNCD